MHALLVSVALIFAAPPASDADLRLARQLYEQGRTEYRNGNFKKAIAEFLAANEIKPSAALLYNVAEAYEKLGDPAKAVEHYERHLNADPAASDRAAVEATISSLKARLQGVAAQPTETAPTAAPAAATPPVAGTSAAPAEAVAAAPERAAEHSHWLGASLAAAAVVCAGFAIWGAVRVGQYLQTQGESSQQPYHSETLNAQANADNWGTSAIVLGVAAAGGATGAVFTW
jgi:tetratricopeptide (TPR) repeat protein